MLQTDRLVTDFAADVRRDLALAPKQLQSKYLYDALGSSLFEAICRLPWYRITRAERRLLEQRAPDVIARLTRVSADAVPLFVELGCGSGEKLVILAEALQTAGGHGRVHLIVAQEIRRDRWRGALDDFLLLGADLVKPERDLLIAYDDPLGVTAAFNRNLLVRINRELGGSFDIDAFAHRAVWNPAAQRIEMHLESLADQAVTIASAGITVRFARGERIWTESSYKYDESQIEQMGIRAGFAVAEQWIDDDARFALTLFSAI